MNTLSLTPLFRQSVGFDRFSDLFEAAFMDDESPATYPPYNILKQGDDDYTITMAVAGFAERDINMTLQNNSLIVAGNIQDKKDEGVEYLHRGIATRAFERTFHLADHMHVKAAKMQDGLLSIHIAHEVPEEAKPRMIPINGGHSIESKMKQ